MTLPAQGKWVSANDIRTNYYEEGDGPVVVLLHGSGPGVSAWTNWRGVIGRLAGSFRVLAPDIAGFGFTERQPGARYDIGYWVAHLLGFVDALGLERVSLVGNSFGGSLALAAAARHGPRFDRLVLMGTPCGTFMMTPGLRAGWDYTPGRDNMRGVLRHFPFEEAVISDEMVEERYQTSLLPGAQEGLHKLLPRPSDEAETPLSGMPESTVATVGHPTLVLHGRDDRVIPPELGLRLARAMPNADLHLFTRCGHWVQAERLEAFIALSAWHLAGTGGAAGPDAGT
jgi:2-hydroxy-6-oxo-octa-2,4-dienoate hydrolase